MIQYEIDGRVLLLRVAPEGFAFLRDALHAAATDATARPKMPLLLDVRSELTSHRYEDVHWRLLILRDMVEQFGPRWALWVSEEPVRAGIQRMLAVFSEVEGLEVRVFTEKAAALSWLRERS